MENPSGGSGGRHLDKYRCLEENILPLLDTSFAATDQHNVDDCIAFLEAVRSTWLVTEMKFAPSKLLLGKLFQIFQEKDSLDIIMRSYQLLSDLNKRYPRVYLDNVEKSGTTCPPEALPELVIMEEAWSPFGGLDVASRAVESDKDPGRLLDSWNFHSLIKDVAERDDDKGCEAPSTKSLRKLFLLQYLIDVIEDDFRPRSYIFKENMNWTVLRESILNKLLGSRKITYKALVKDCMSSMSYLQCDVTASTEKWNETRASSVELKKACKSVVDLASPEVEKTTCVSLKRFLLLIMELDSSRCVADKHGLITRVDGVRTPAGELILDELTYDNELLFPFFVMFDEPRQKLELIIQYFQKYIPKPSVRTRSSNGGLGSDATFDGILKFLSNGNNAKGITRKLGRKVAEFLLAHAFQAYLSLLSEHLAENVYDDKEASQGSCLVETCKSVKRAFTCLRGEVKESEMDLWSEEALFTAGAIISMKSMELEKGV